MTSSTPTAEPRQVPAPVMRDQRAFCPRCDAMLQFDHDEYVCLACGYEYLLETRELELLQQARRQWRKAAAVVALPVAGLPLGGGMALLVGLIAVGVIASMIARRRRRSLLYTIASSAPRR